MIEEMKKAADNGIKINIAGIHIEGPYLNPGKRGAHDAAQIRPIDMTEFTQIMDTVHKNGFKLHITIAPELPNAALLIKTAVANGASAAAGHTEADGEQIKRAVQLGLNNATHLFNAMPSVHHRIPGTVTHILLEDIFAELICDGVHLAPETVNLASKIKGCEKTVIVSDSMEAAGLDEGEYSLGGGAVEVKDGKVTLKGTDTIAGSVTNLYDELLNFMRFTSMPLEKALWAVSRNPCAAVNLYERKGSIAVGKDADFLLTDKELNIKAAYAGGNIIR
jgi:N-acetylglucosamine-6-phosphate deacetylase